MVLPAEARSRLVAPLLMSLSQRLPIRSVHTLPVAREVWETHSGFLIAGTDTLVALTQKYPPATASFSDLNAWLSSLIEARGRVSSLLLSLEPFEPFDEAWAVYFWEISSQILHNIADAVTKSAVGPPLPEDWINLSASWPSQGGIVRENLLGASFGVDGNFYNDQNQFQASKVLSRYKYNNGQMLMQVSPHLASLGLTVTADVLATVSVVGWLMSAPDQVFAYTSMHALVWRMMADNNASVASDVDQYLRQREEIDRQSRHRLMRDLTEANNSLDHEFRANLIADGYKRLVEGPIRHYGWALLCLDREKWSSPPTLSPVREALFAAGGIGRIIAEACILLDLRNGEVHETLHWDGRHEAYVTDDNKIEMELVLTSIRLGLSFQNGCDAAVAFWRALRHEPNIGLPRNDESHRMPARERAEAYFGSNGLNLVRADFNRHDAHIVLTSLEVKDVNPCFQALLASYLLMPGLTGFKVFVRDRDDAIISVPSSHIEATLPVWQEALAFDQVPFSSFLPMNLAARVAAGESDLRAIRSTAWIAIDDVLDSVDGHAEANDIMVDADLKRVQLALHALDAIRPLVNSKHLVRLAAAQGGIDQLRSDFGDSDSAFWRPSTREPSALTYLRGLWSSWGPVPRHPKLVERVAKPLLKPQPTLRTVGPGDAFSF